MDRRSFLERAQLEGLLVTESHQEFADASDAAPHPFQDFHVLPIYRSYVAYLALRDLPNNYLDQLAVPSALALVREPDNSHDRRAVAVYHDTHRLGYLPREDTVLLGKLSRRGLPLRCRLIGVQLEQRPQQQLSLEVSLLYPPHPSTDAQLQQAERDRLAGLQRVASKPSHRLRITRDPLSAAHVYPDYYGDSASQID